MQLLRLPQTTGAPSLHVLAALGVMKPATFEKTDKHRPDRGKPLILKWFPSSSPWGEQLGCSGGHSCSRCLRVSTRQESSVLDSSGFWNESWSFLQHPWSQGMGMSSLCPALGTEQFKTERFFCISQNLTSHILGKLCLWNSTELSQLFPQNGKLQAELYQI